jgi:hypothetical protein
MAQRFNASHYQRLARRYLRTTDAKTTNFTCSRRQAHKPHEVARLQQRTHTGPLFLFFSGAASIRRSRSKAAGFFSGASNQPRAAPLKKKTGGRFRFFL